MSVRARRIQRNHQRLAKPARLNLVALMDIFTILVLFLIVNNGDVEVLQPDPRIELPQSWSEQTPRAALTITLTADAILLQDSTVMSTVEASDQSAAVLPALAQALHAARSARGDIPPADGPDGDAIVIMGDRHTPYRLLRQVMATCTEENYRNIAFAVNSVPARPAHLQASAITRDGFTP